MMTKEQKEYEVVSFNYGKRLFAHAMVGLLSRQGIDKVRSELRKVLGRQGMEPFETDFDSARLEELIMKLEPMDQEGYVPSNFSKSI